MNGQWLIHRAGLLLFMLCAVIALCGCSSSGSVSLQQWQKGLEQHLAEQEHGDSSFLRDTGGSDRSRFALIGAPLPEKSTDVSGALLGRQNVSGTDWLIFIVAATKDSDVEDVRIAMFADDAGPSRWIVSESNADALGLYVRAKDSQWRRMNPVRTKRPVSPGLFPPEEDQFRMTIAGNTVTVVEENCGARWTVVVK